MMGKKIIFTKDVGKSYSLVSKHFIQRKRFCDRGESWFVWGAGAWNTEAEKGKVRAVASNSFPPCQEA